MNTRAKIVLALGLGLAIAGAGVAVAQSVEEPVVAAARASGAIGEQADGYIGFASAPSAALKAAVDAINIKRRAIYTDLAGKRGATVQEVAAARGCDQLRTRVGNGESYSLGGGVWKKKTGAVELPSYCS